MTGHVCELGEIYFDVNAIAMDNHWDVKIFHIRSRVAAKIQRGPHNIWFFFRNFSFAMAQYSAVN